MDRPLVSCIIPAFNGAAFLGPALDSIRGQTYPTLEIIVVDDGSSDGTADLVSKYGHGVRYVWQENAGPAAACNHGMRRSRGRFFAFLEQDDLWHPRKVELQMQALEGTPIDYCVTMIENFLEDAPAAHETRLPATRTGPLPGYVTQTLLAPRSTFRRVGPFDTERRFSHGTEWFLRARARGLRGELIHEVLVRRRIHGANVSLRRADASRDEYLHLLKRSLDGRSDPHSGAPTGSDGRSGNHADGGQNLAALEDRCRHQEAEHVRPKSRRPIYSCAHAVNRVPGRGAETLVQPVSASPVKGTGVPGPGGALAHREANRGERRRRMRVLVTGAQGQLGSELVRLALQHGWPAIPLARQNLDIGDAEGVERAIRKARPSAVVNAAAFTRVDEAESHPEEAQRVNRDGARNLARACKEEGIPIVHFSTDYVFDGRATRPYLPDDPPAPLGVYGRSKLEGDLAVRETTDRHLILRTAWVFGVHGHNFVKSILRHARERDELKVVDDQRGSPTAAHDLAEAALTALEHVLAQGTGWGTYHFVNAGSTTWHGFAERILAIASRHGAVKARRVVPITTEELGLPAPRPRWSVLDTTSYVETFGLAPRPWEDALESV
ncbi:MAG: dTDP-4-dehydrorhamnose reductase, partial [Gemmatimonadota bacterium]